jgi:hypothetical protein
VTRSVCAPLDCMQSYVNLTQQQLDSGGGPAGSGEPDLELLDRIKASGCATLEDYLANCNAHLGVQNSKPARYCAYFDM